MRAMGIRCPAWGVEHWVAWWMNGAPSDSEAHRLACEARWVLDFWTSVEARQAYLAAVAKRRGAAALLTLETALQEERNMRWLTGK